MRINNLDSSSAIAGTLVELQMDELGIDYMQRRAALINAVTLDQVKAAAQKLLLAEPRDHDRRSAMCRGGQGVTAAAHGRRQRGDPTFAIAFGGGGARGLAHIHVIEALDELGIRPVAIAGSSIGAIMGAGMAAGMTGADIHDYARSILGRRAEVASRMWRARPGTLRRDGGGGLRVSQFNIERILKAFLPDADSRDVRRIEDPAAGDGDRLLRPPGWRCSTTATCIRRSRPPRPSPRCSGRCGATACC